MAVVIEYKESAPTFGQVTSTGRLALADQQSESYLVRVYDDGGANLNDHQWVEQYILAQANSAPGVGEVRLPVVNESVYWYDDAGAQRWVCPWMVCTGLRAERDPNYRTLWRVTAEYRTGDFVQVSQAALVPILVPSVLTQYPYIRENLWSEETKPLWEESKSSGGEDGLKLRLPTGSRYSEPFRRRYPKRDMRQWQFETFLSETDFLTAVEDRLFSVNSNSFAGEPTPDPDPDINPPPTLMITQIDWQVLRLPFTGNTFTGAYMMIYTIEKSTWPGGWLDRRGLVDRFFLETGGDLTTKQVYRDPADGIMAIDCNINKDGSLRNQTDPLEYKNYDVQPRIPFALPGGFLRDD